MSQTHTSTILYDPDGTPMREVWRLRKVRDEVRPAGWFIANARNWRVHPQAQRGALRGGLSEIGWLDSVKVNLRSDPAWGADQHIPTLFDGHCRIEEGLKEGEDAAIPLEYYDLDPTEEAKALATLDPIAALATPDPMKLDDLLRDVQTESAAVQTMLTQLAAKAGVIEGEPIDPHELWQGMPDYENNEISAYKSLIVHFENKDHYEMFSRLIEQSLTPSTRSIWYPKRDRIDEINYRVEDES